MGRSSKVKKTRTKVSFTVLLLFSVFYYFCLPKPLFEKPFSTLILDENGSVLSARIAEDDQWRFVPNDSIPNKFEQCILTFEDKYFYSHPGFNPVSLARALWKNLRAGKVVSGGSTLSMQVIRMSRNNPSRTVWEKCKEITLATRLELAYSKREILSFYCGYAPFGGNTVGIEAASWRYFGRSPFDLSWAEAATLAVLPNAPGLIHPGKNRDQLKRKRNRLLQLLVKEGIMDKQQYELALLEALPDRPFPLPNASPHLAEWLIQKKGSNRYQTTLEDRLQEICIQSLERFKPTHEANEVYNGAVLLIDAETGEVKAYVGNHNNPKTPGFHNDMVQASRSSGSILKPFLYSSMLSNGSLWPKELLKDTPLILADFKPENFSHQYKGAVPADEALSQSLNIPFVLLLKEYGIQRFKEDLQAWGFSTINRSANNYGLSLILGGAEVNMWDLGNAYYRFAKKLKEYEVGELKEASSSIHVLTDQADRGKPIDINQGAIHHTIQAMTQLTRPHTELGWQFFDNQQIAWKTGTSFGHRDAWAVGMTSRYIAVVWIGNSSGEGRPGLVGAKVAGPVLFDVLRQLPQGNGFTIPYDEMRWRKVCAKSGLPAAPNCERIDSIYLPHVPFVKKQCPYHVKVFTNAFKEYRLNQNCAHDEKLVEQKWFVLPPTMAWYYVQNNPSYEPLPPWKKGCASAAEKVLDIVYPSQGAQIFLPKDLDESKQSMVMEASHQRADAKLFWHLNERYIGTTQDIHQLPIQLQEGEYKLFIEDKDGNSTQVSFIIK